MANKITMQTNGGNMLFIAPRLTGRTTYMVNWVKGDPERRAILTRTEEEARSLKRPPHNLSDYQVIALPVLLKQRWVEFRERQLWLDNAEGVLDEMAANSGFTITRFTIGGHVVADDKEVKG